MNDQINYSYYKSPGGFFFRCREIPWRIIEQWQDNKWIEVDIGLKGLDEIYESELSPEILSTMKEIILSEKELNECQKNGLLKDLKPINSKIRIPRGPKRLI